MCLGVAYLFMCVSGTGPEHMISYTLAGAGPGLKLNQSLLYKAGHIAPESRGAAAARIYSIWQSHNGIWHSHMYVCMYVCMYVWYGMVWYGKYPAGVLNRNQGVNHAPTI